jgi:NADH dehydrogenase [ubiquinone] 1 alpha subcomplex assembly factor 7
MLSLRIFSKRYHSDLSKIISNAIRASGPIPVSAFMQYALYHPVYGYYARKESKSTRMPEGIPAYNGKLELAPNENSFIGKQGDFITSPEVSQLFGEMIGVFLAMHIEKVPLDVPIHLIELGPGNGTLLCDMLNTLWSFGSTKKRISRVSLVEISDTMIHKQRAQLEQLRDRLMNNEAVRFIEFKEDEESKESPDESFSGITVTWHRNIDTIDSKSTQSDRKECILIISHEFLDALPIRQFHKRSHSDPAWHEVLVDASDVDSAENNARFRPVLSKLPLSPSFLSPSWIKLQEMISSKSWNWNKGLIYEYCPMIQLHAKEVARLLNQSSFGLALWIDYGYDGSTPPGTNTLRGIQQHTFCSPYIEPGKVDLSADVDFSSLSLEFSQAMKRYGHEDTQLCKGPITQGAFLQKLGIDLRLRHLLKRAGHQRRDPLSIKSLLNGYQRLLEVSNAYQVLVGYKHALPFQINGIFD